MKVEFRFNCTGAWVDYSEETDVSTMDLVIDLNEQNEPRRKFSSAITVTGKAYKDVYNHLMVDANRYSNRICVRITDVDCGGEELLFRVETQNIQWCDSGECETTLNLVEDNTILDCIDQTDIWDNHLGWFGETRSPILHPKFRYCDVTRPTYLLAVLLTVVTVVDLVIQAINVIVIVINAIINAVNTLPGVNIGTITPMNTLGQLILGCDRVHPAPFIRTYTSNVCQKCGITVNQTTNPIFYNTSSLYYNLTLLTAYMRKGLKYNATSNENYLGANRPDWRLSKLYNSLSEVFNARWFIKGNELHFNRKDLIGAQLWGATPLIDVSDNGAENEKLIDNVCFRWNGKPKIYKLEVLYSTDTIDPEGDRMRRRFGGYAEDKTSINYKAYEKREFIEFGAQSYTYDGNDTVYDILVRDYNMSNGIQDYRGILKIRADFFRLGKLIIYDGTSSFQSAEAIGKAYTSFNTAGWDDDGIFGPAGWYRVKNWPMMADPVNNPTSPNLWEFHKIDMPTASKKDNIEFEFSLNFCCSMYAYDLYQRVQFNNSNVGEINYIKIEFTTREIQIKGNLIN